MSKRLFFLVAVAGFLCMLIGLIFSNSSLSSFHLPLVTSVGEPVDRLHGVTVYYNGIFSNVSGRNVRDGYNLGLKYQCVEFVKRYYYERYRHKMPNSYGHAKDFFNKRIGHGKYNRDRGLMQYANAGRQKPKVGDLIVFDASRLNAYGHVAIVSQVKEDEVQIVQQNTGSSRAWLNLTQKGNEWHVEGKRTLGWLRRK